MKIPINIFIDGIQNGKVYYFSSTKINTEIPHYFICTKKTTQDLLILVCCTSDKNDKNKKLAELRGLHNTLVWINPTEENGFTKDTFVNCNTIFKYSVEDFKDMYEQNLLEYKGEIEENHLEQTIIGLLASPQIEEEIKQLFREN